MAINKIPKELIFLIAITVIGAALRFYKLDWGQGLFTHPDEYHIAISVSQLSFPTQMNPHFFSYGTVTIYLIYFTKLLLSALGSQLSAVSPFLIGRFYSAFFSTFTIFLIYRIGRFYLPKKFALLGAAFAALTPGLIQQAHFATPESNLIFFLLASLLGILYYLKTGKLRYLILASVSLGLALGVKVSSAFFLPLPLLAVAFKTLPDLMKFIKLNVLSLTIILITFIIVAPFVFLDFTSWQGSFTYESSLAKGEIPVFYTRQFIDTTPFVFQLEKILPFALGPAILVTGLIGFLFVIVKTLRGGPLNTHYIMLAASFLLILIPNSLLFAKWTRFIAPVFPFFALFPAFFLFEYSKLKLPKTLTSILNVSLTVLVVLWAAAFFSIYARPDIRITASRWLEANSPPNSTFMVEGGNMVDLPLAGYFRKISLDFYQYEGNPKLKADVRNALVNSDFFLVQSRRVFYNHQRLPGQFPETARFYNELFSGRMGFEEIKQFSSYPQISAFGTTLEFPDENAEETWSVFDHPVIRVFKKQRQLTLDEYGKLLETPSP